MGTVLAFIAAAAGRMLDLGEAGIDAALGYGVVFVGLVLLMLVIMIVGKIMTSGKKKTSPETSAPEAPAAPAAPAEKAPGSAGGVKLYDVSEREAAMLMAIVADKTGKPLNELRFISIKEVKEP